MIWILFILFTVSCSYNRHIPLSIELETKFYENEWAFDSICKILLQSRYGDQFPYNDEYYDGLPPEKFDWGKIRYLSEQDKLIMDSLYNMVGCEVIYFQSKDHAVAIHQNLQDRDVRFIYTSGGWFGKGIHRSIVYMPTFPPFAKLITCDIDSLVNWEYENGHEKLISYYKRIKGPWYINVSAYQ